MTRPAPTWLDSSRVRLNCLIHSASQKGRKRVPIHGDIMCIICDMAVRQTQSSHEMACSVKIRKYI